MSACIDPYQQVLDRLRREGRDPVLVRRVAELLALLELTTTLAEGAAGDDGLGVALRVVTRELQVERGALFVRSDDGAWTLRAGRGLPPGAPERLGRRPPTNGLTAVGPGDEAHDRLGLVLLCSIDRDGRPLALLGLGPRNGEQPFGSEEQDFLRCVGASAAAALDGARLLDELRRVSRKASLDALQLHNLLDIGRDLSGSLEEQAIHELVATSVMGHFVVARCALYRLGPEGLALADGRGLRTEAASATPIPLPQARDALSGLAKPTTIAELPDGPLRRQLEQARLALAVPLVGAAGVEGVLALGERASGAPFSQADKDFALALGRQALAALDNARLHRIREQKQRQDRELQLAREIQRSLFPLQPPELPGFEVAADSLPCHEVGGDAYDWLPLGGDRLALVIADVSGKGTPASLLMASVHASVQALAGTAAPARVVERLNRFLFAHTQASRFVTLFYAELDAAARRLLYVNAGHVPPYRLARDGGLRRLAEGGPALGLLPEAAYETGELWLAPGDVVAMVTDGVTEARSPADQEFGDERVWATLRALSAAGSARVVLEGLVAAANGWAAGAGSGDDLTALVLMAR